MCGSASESAKQLSESRSGSGPTEMHGATDFLKNGMVEA
jgi:hypothetical protein